jgi:anion-transporting  ArsA/GET3 family ATPase
MVMDETLTKLSLIVVCGSGGVGKTTMSAVLGVRAAQLGRRTLVLTIDPARRLATALGIERWTEEEKQVEDPTFKGSLHVAMVDAKAVFDGFVKKAAPSPADADRILNNKLYDALSRSLNGSQEFSSLERLYQAVSSGKYDLVILDTPPAQHAKEFLLAPQRFYDLFQDSLLKWFVAPQESTENKFRQIFQRGTSAVLGGLEKITGGEFMRELREFFVTIQTLQGIIREHSVAIHRMLSGPRSGFIVVTSFDERKLAEASQFQRDLERGGYLLSSVIINRAFPEFFGRKRDLANWGDKSREGEAEILVEYYKILESYFQTQIHAYNEFEKELSSGVGIIRIPDFVDDIHDLAGLKTIASEVAVRAQS